MKKLILILGLFSSVATQAAITQLNVLSWAKADGSDQTTNVQTAVNVAVSNSFNLYIPPGVNYNYNAITNTSGLMIEEWTVPGRMLLRGTVEINGPFSGSFTNEWGGVNVLQYIGGTMQFNLLSGLNESLIGVDTNGVVKKMSPGFSNTTNTVLMQIGPFTPLYVPVALGTNTLTDGPFRVSVIGSTNIYLDGRFYMPWLPTNQIVINTSEGLSTTNLNGAAPSALVGLSPVVGTAVTFIPSDSAPALDQGIAPTWTALHRFTKNVFSLRSAGSTTVIDATYPSPTNNVTAALTYTHATNGVDGAESTVVWTLPNGSGSDWGLTLPLQSSGVNGWMTNKVQTFPTVLTNGTTTVIYGRFKGATDTLAKQTNFVLLGVEYY